jgi:hypothetical protein
MARWRTISIVVAGIAVAAAATPVLFLRYGKPRPIDLRGAVIRMDTDPNKQSPIADVEVVADDGHTTAETKSSASGGFNVTFQPVLSLRDRPLTMRFRHPNYAPLELTDVTGNQLYIANLMPLPDQKRVEPVHIGPQVPIANVAVRYTVNAATIVDVGSGVKTFQVVNKGNVPCNGQSTCSPDGKWKASIGTISLDAGPENEFRNARISCIAGPCPFTRIERDDFAAGGRAIHVAVRNWSDTTTFLLQAEAVHPMISDNVQKTYPVIFNDTMNFSLPAAAQGTSIEAEIGGTAVVFPLGPNLYLSWARCEEQIEQEKNKLYRCELKPGYVFR